MQCICSFLWSTVTYLVATQTETVDSLGSDLEKLNNSVAKAVVFQKHQELQDAWEKKNFPFLLSLLNSALPRDAVFSIRLGPKWNEYTNSLQDNEVFRQESLRRIYPHTL